MCFIKCLVSVNSQNLMSCHRLVGFNSHSDNFYNEFYHKVTTVALWPQRVTAINFSSKFYTNLPWHFLIKLIVSVWPLFSARFRHVWVSPPIVTVAFKLAPFSNSSAAQSLCPLLHAISSGVYSDNCFTKIISVNKSLTSFEPSLYSNWSTPTAQSATIDTITITRIGNGGSISVIPDVLISFFN